MKKKWVVRICQTHTDEGVEVYEGDNLGGFVECLRYAGMVVVHQTDPRGLTSLCFDLLLPDSSRENAERQAARMCSFGYNAAAAPAV